MVPLRSGILYGLSPVTTQYAVAALKLTLSFKPVMAEVEVFLGFQKMFHLTGFGRATGLPLNQSIIIRVM